MKKSIFCINPNCRSIIDIPNEIESVVCQKCNVWQLVSMAEPVNPETSTPEQITNVDTSDQFTPPIVNPSPSIASPQEVPSPHFPLPDPVQPPSVDAPIDTPADAVLPPNLNYSEATPTQSDTTGNPDPQKETGNSELGYLNTMTGEKLKLKLGKNTIGRQATDLVINDRTISRKHCIIEILSNELGAYDYFLFDIGHETGNSSTNGVFISGRSQRLEDHERIRLYNGAIIILGNVHLVLAT